ncbi:MAG: hypothetical protein AABW47_02385 [Nanoarchaeota archaeon]
MIKILLNYSREFEIQRIKNTLKRLGWYIDNGYSLDSLSFPKNVSLDKLQKIPDEELSEVIKVEYDETKFISTAESVEQMYHNYDRKLTEFIKSTGVALIPEIKVFLTNYGIGGSYSLPNEIIVNISKYYSIGLLRNILHEIIHLHIQPLIDKYKIGQWGKETLVDLLFERAFPDLCKRQNIPIDTVDIEKIFKENFPNIERVTSLVSGLTT